MNRKNQRDIDYTLNSAPIRLARLWAAGMSGEDADIIMDWTPGRGYGLGRPSTWAEKRAMVQAQRERAGDHVMATRARMTHLDAHADQLDALRRQKRNLEQNPSGVNRMYQLSRVQSEIAQIEAGGK